jgi:peroxiredoxin
MTAEDRRIQAEVGGAARADLGTGVQSPGYMIRDFTLRSSQGQDIRISSFRGRANLILVFLGNSDAMLRLVDEALAHSCEFTEQEARVVAIHPYRREDLDISATSRAPILDLYDETLGAYRFSGATDKNGLPVPLVYLTDRFGEIFATYTESGRALPLGIEEILRALEFVNQQCPECEPPEWPR